MDTVNQSRFDLFKKQANEDFDSYRIKMNAEFAFDFIKIVQDLQDFQNKVNGNIFIYLFGEQLGNHLGEKYFVENNRNLLRFLNSINSEYRFFILNEIKTNKVLYSYS